MSAQEDAREELATMSVLSTIEEFEAALDALRAAFARQLADDAATIQSLLREQGDMRAAVERVAARLKAEILESMRRAALRDTPTEDE